MTPNTSISPPAPDVIVYKRKNGWVVHRADKERAERIFAQRGQAITFANFFFDKGSDIIVLKEGGAVDSIKAHRS